MRKLKGSYSWVVAGLLGPLSILFGKDKLGQDTIPYVNY